MPNMQSILRAHNKAHLVAKPSEEERKCNCRKKDSCPLQNECLTKSVVYKATVSEQNTTNEKVCFGQTENSFKQWYNAHTQSFRHDKHRTNTELSKFIWNLKDNEKAYEIKWSVAAQARAYSNESKRCNLCLSEKLFIISNASNPSVLNKRTELISKCRHENRFYLSNSNRGITWLAYFSHYTYRYPRILISCLMIAKERETLK